VKQFSLTASIGDHLSSDLAFEFGAVPDPSTLQMWPATLGQASIDGHVVHMRMSMYADELTEGFGQIAGSPLGQRLGTLVQAARYLPTRNAALTRTKPTIYGLDSGPKEVNQNPSR
jgi:hypothetical protein